MFYIQKQSALFLLFLLLCLNALQSQNLISSNYKGSKTKNQLIAQFNVPFIQYGAKYYKVTYTSPDIKGNLDTLSGLLVVPDVSGITFPRLVYQHGTSDCKTCVPSRYGSAGGGEGDVGMVFAGMGYVALLPDYVGMGDGRGFQAYVHAKSEASAAVDMIRASNAWLVQNNFSANTQLFVTGYSQGGHAAMALHRAIEKDLSAEMSVTAAAHLSGPYSVSGVMRNLILSQSAYYYPAYIPNTALSYQNVYGNLYNQLSDMFKPEYATLIQQYYEGSISLGTLNTQLIDKLTTLTGASVPRRMIRDEVLLAVETDPQNPINLALKDNDVFQWGPQAPTRIFYCMGDDQVPFQNSIVARDSMPTYGVLNFSATDVNPAADHGGCVTPALTQALFFFASFQQITSKSTEAEEQFQVNISPNPASDVAHLSNLPLGSSLRISDTNGREYLFLKELQSPIQRLDIQGFPSGMYSVQVRSPKGKVWVRKLMVFEESRN